MRPRSIALTTELALAVTRGRVTDRGDYLVVETPDDPGYYYGNLLVLPAAPQVGEVGYWTRRFTDELGGNPAIRHVTFWWDGITGDAGAADELRAAGFTIETSVVMTADNVMPPSIDVHPLHPDQVLETAELAWAVGDRHDETYREFLQRRAMWHRDLVARGTATFWGVHDGDALVASLGLVTLGTVDGTAPPFGAAAGRAQGPSVDPTAPPFGAAAGRAQGPSVDPTAPPFGAAAGRAQGPSVDPTAPPFGAAAGRAQGPSVARYQDVQTALAYRRRGYAGALLTAAAHKAFADGLERVVIIAIPGSDAERVYTRVGFRAVERTASACRYPPSEPRRR